MKKCKKCGKLNSSQAKFCKYCGAKLPKNTVKQPPKKNYKRCPKCGTKNMLKAKFCTKCGYSFNQQKSHHVRTRTRTQYKHVSPNTTNVNLGSYFKWLQQTLINPMHKQSAHTYFGLISLIALAVLMWLACILSTGSEYIGNEIDSIIIKYLPLKVVAMNEGYAQSPIGYLILSIFFVALPVAIAYASKYLILRQHQTIFSFCNQFAKYINVNLILAILLIFSAVISQATLTSVFVILISTVMGLSVFAVLLNNQAKKFINAFYVAICALLVSHVGLALIATIVGIILK